MTEKSIKKKVLDPTNVLLTFLIGVGVILFVIGSIASFELEQYDAITLAVITVFCYAGIILILLKPKIVEEKPVKEKIITKIKEIEKIKKVEVPVIKKVEKIVEKPIIKRIFIERAKKKKPSVPRPNYVGSSQTEVYHKKSCKFSKLIKKKYKVSEDNRKYFSLRGYKPCKSCNPHRGPEKQIKK